MTTIENNLFENNFGKKFNNHLFTQVEITTYLLAYKNPELLATNTPEAISNEIRRLIAGAWGFDSWSLFASNVENNKFSRKMIISLMRTNEHYFCLFLGIYVLNNFQAKPEYTNCLKCAIEFIEDAALNEVDEAVFYLEKNASAINQLKELVN